MTEKFRLGCGTFSDLPLDAMKVPLDGVATIRLPSSVKGNGEEE